MIAYLTRDENGRLIFSKDKPANWESKYNPLNDIFPEITSDNSPKMVEIKIVDSLGDDKNRKCFDEENVKYSTEFECPDGYEFQDEKGNSINTNKIVLKKKAEEHLTVQKMINLLSSIGNPNAELVIQYEHNPRFIDEFSSKMYDINIEDGTDCRKNCKFLNERIKGKVVITINSKHKIDLPTKKWSW